MKSEFISKEKQAQEIDWSKPQLLKHVEDAKIVVLSNGTHSKNLFCGTELLSKMKNAEMGMSFDSWSKRRFIPCEPGEQVILTA